MVAGASRHSLGRHDVPLPIDLLTTIRRYFSLATVCALLMLCALAGTARAEWGELGHFAIPTGKAEKDVNFTSSASVLAFATDTSDSSYYVGDEPNPGEFRIQRFVEGQQDASISFTPPEPKKVHDGIGETGVGLQLAVDSANNRVYALVLFKRRNVSENEENALIKEEKELENEGKTCEPPKTCWERVPLDSEEHAAGELYGFELASGKLVSAKEKEGIPVPIVPETTSESSTTAFADQSEQPKEALLNPRGMAIDPKSGDPVILGVEDEESDEKVEKEEAEKQCRAAAQFIAIVVKTGKLTGGKLGHRYVDKADALRPGEPGCQPEELTDVPLSPVVTPGGNLLIYSGAQSEGQIWEVPTPGSESGEGELEITPTMLYGEHQLGGLLNLEPPEEGAGPVMSFAPEGATEGRIYLSVKGFEHEPIPLALHYTESPDKASEVSDLGWTAGGAGEMCGIPSPDNVTAVMGAGQERVLVLDAYLEEGGSHSPRVESFAFGPNGATSGCPKATLTAPHMIFGLAQDASEAPTDEPVTLASELKGADAKSVKWEFKYKNPATGEEGEEAVEQTGAQLRNHLGEYEFLPLEYEFKHAGNYEISETVQGDDLAGETVKAAETLKVAIKASPPILKPALPKAVRAGEEAATLSATVEDPNESEKPKLHLKKVKWEFGDGSAAVEETPGELPNPGELQVKHTFASRCGKGKCKITLTVEDTAAEGTPVKTSFEITVNESVAEEAQHQKEAQENAAKEAQEAKEKQEAAEKAAKEAQEAKERQAAAEKAAKEAQEARAAKEAKEAKEKEEQKKHEEEAHKPPTRAQLLAKALKQCKKGPKSKRGKCEATARKKYGPKSKKKRKK